MASLSLELGVTGTSILMKASDEYEADLRRLASRFPNSRTPLRAVLEVDIDDFLRHLVALTRWPSPDDVFWQPEAKAIAEDSIRDAAAARAALRQPPVIDEATLRDALGPRWVGDLTSFQVRDLSHIMGLRHGANFSVPGAGKTRVGLAAYVAEERRGSSDRLLIVSPKSAFESWTVENAQVLRPSPLRIQHYLGDVDPTAEALLVNYERLPDARGQLARWMASGRAMMILDEAHRMKLGRQGAYGSACLALGPLARRRLILTGTPAPNGVEDLKSLMAFVWPGAGRQVVSQAVGDGDLRAASRALRPFFTRTTKRELGLPPVETRIRRLSLPPLHREIYRALLGFLSDRAPTGAADLEALGKISMYLLMAADSPSLLATGATRYEPLAYRVPPLEAPPGARLRELMRDLPSYELSPKYKETLALVAENAALGRKTLVWSTFVRSLTTLERMLARFAPAVVHGGTQDRESQLIRFREDQECMVLLSNPATLGEGISLHQVCHDAVFVDRDFAAGRYLQSLDRIHRLGLKQDQRTTVTVLLSEATVDEVVDRRLAAKLKFMSAVLDDPDVEVMGDLAEEPEVGSGLDMADVQALMGHLRATTT